MLSGPGQPAEPATTSPPCADRGMPPVDERPGQLVCVVEDDPGVRDSLDMMLEAHGFTVDTHVSGGDFLADHRPRRIACLIVDYDMPAMTGLDVVAALQRQRITVPTILVTAALAPAIAQHASQLGVTAVLEKPFAAARLVELVRAAIGGAR